MRDMIYWLVSQLLPHKQTGQGQREASHNIAVDITFGSIGYRLALARAFNTVSSYFDSIS